MTDIFRNRHHLEYEIYQLVKDAAFNTTLGTTSRWAVQRRTMQDGEPYSLADYPYVESILNSRARKNWIMKGAQTGLTEAGITIALFEIDYHGRDVIYFFPTGKMAERFSKTRFTSAIQMSPYLSKAVTNDSVEIKQIGPATLHILGANSMANLKGTSSGRLIFDELDEWSDQQIYLAEERGSGQKNNDTIIWGLSTPKFPNCGTHKQFLTSTQEHYFFLCPHCGEMIELLWEDSFELFGESVDDPAVHDSYLKCSKCQGKLPHEEKKNWLRAKTQGGSGEWIATNPEADPALSRGFWLSQLYSPTVSPGEVAIKYLRGFGDEDARREFHNSCLGLPYIEAAHKVNDKHIDDTIKASPVYSLESPTIIPKTAKEIVTLGIDQGGPVHHWCAVKWDFDFDRFGDPNDRAVGKVIGLGKVMHDDWARLQGLITEYQVRMTVIDFFPEPTNARQFARRFKGIVYLCQYVTGVSGREVRIMKDDYGASLIKVDKVGWLTKSLGRIMNQDIQLPVDLPLEFRHHVMSPVRTLKKKDGQYVAEYTETGTAGDHYAHALNYAEIALKILDPNLHGSQTLGRIR